MSREPSPEVTLLDLRQVNHATPNRSASRGLSQVNGLFATGNGDSNYSVNSLNRDSPKATPERVGSPSQAHNGSAARTSSSAAGPGAASVPRASGARTSTTAAPPRPPQPSVPRPVAGSAKTASLARPTSSSTATRPSVAPGAGGAAQGGAAAAAIKASVMASTMPEGQFAGYSGDVAKYLKELVRRRDEGVYLRVLPKRQQLQQLVMQEGTARELALQQEQTARQSIVHKAHEERAKKMELSISKASKEKLDEQKRLQQEELALQKTVVAALQADTDKEIRERLRIIQALHPKLNPTTAALAEVKNERSDCAVLAALLEEDKKVTKALKGNARHAKSKTAEVDGGALPFWLKDCVAASFNVAAILAGSPLRASVMDAPSIASKVAADKKIVVVRASTAADAPVVAWAHTRVAMPDAATATTALLALLGATAGEASGNDAALKVAALPECGGTAQFAHVVWPKEDCAAVTKLAKSPKTECGCLQNHTVGVLAHSGLASHEFTTKDVIALGEAAASQ